jgi:hypothetical protein
VRAAAGQNGRPYTVASRVPRCSGGHVTAVASVPCVCFWSSFSDIWVLIKGDTDIFKNSLDRFFSCNFFLIKRSSKQKFIWLVVSWNI